MPRALGGSQRSTNAGNARTTDGWGYSGPPAEASRNARLAEIFDYLHRGITTAVENMDSNEEGTEVKLGFNEWQTIQAVQLLLARYTRAMPPRATSWLMR